MKIKRIIFYCLVFTVAFSIISSCKKKDDIDTNTTSASDCVNAENYFSEAKNIVDEAGLKSGAYTSILSDTTILVTFDSVNHSNPDTITINFGNNNLSCLDGRSRKGKIVCTYSGNYNDTVISHTIVFSNYYVDNTNVNGILKDSYKGYNTSGHKYYADSINGNIKYTNGKTVTWYSTTKITFTAGDSTTSWMDDSAIIDGTSFGTTSDSDPFSMNINSPLLRNFNLGCRKYFVKGAIQIALTDKPGRTADLGDGSCDDLITVVIDGNIYPAHSN